MAQNAQPGPKTAGSTLQLVSLTLAVLALNLRLMVSGMAQESEAPSVNKFIELFILLAANPLMEMLDMISAEPGPNITTGRASAKYHN